MRVPSAGDGEGEKTERRKTVNDDTKRVSVCVKAVNETVAEGEKK
jgi:hypothetical protein